VLLVPSHSSKVERGSFGPQANEVDKSYATAQTAGTWDEQGDFGGLE